MQRPLALSSEDFRALAHSLSDFTADYLERLPTLRSYPEHIRGVAIQQLFSGDIPQQGLGSAAFDLLPEIFENSRPASPRFFGYVFGSGEPIAALGQFASAVLHQNATAWRSGPSANAIERTVVRWLASAIGCEGFSGSLTLGGSSANLMGLCMAREAKAPANQSGVRGGVLYCSTEAHMSNTKAAALLGLGHDSVRLIPVDDAFRMRAEALREAVRHDLSAGLKPVAVVASAGTTATGSIDPIREIAALCREHNLWLHIDGAFGALASLAIPEAFDGIDLADSISLDPHKWLYQPTGCGCLLYRDPADARRAFSHSGDYARSLSTDPIEGFAFFEESIELSRPFRALALWLSLRYFGLRAFQQSISDDLHLAQVLASFIDAEPRLERLAPVALSAVCFRYIGKSGGAGSSDLDDLNRRILDRVIRRGRVYLSNATIHGHFSLRACIVNHRTTEPDVHAIVTEVLAAADELQG
ncbi:pyridoxal phosphate-dependent decarboxylase family protein [Occallatibacter savannae]|uniref:pyridoxal phosphate-dependent decarboxylase family protein n=1 Tax=Occallatibacter savannae TaxID=1002691 RepID=UPI000D68641E|nr:aminotransferase class V-fold PLP-dependent enzyme [Occallatibacter savannae]